ncbi:MAG: DUF1343 domain-containing protein [Planctomycetota bacterium]|nr:DUF1343 domain-containing protein [Planctomycetaceae bacterium]MDQ3330455.1 DUF1343 domain-containing protein [Planctomycetota bacterium]
MISSPPPIAFGLDRCVSEQPKVLEGARFGLLANMGSVDCELRYAWDVLHEAFPGRLVRLFSPQHGLWGEQQANMVESMHSHHARLDLPVFSLYADRRKPTDEMLDGLDALVIDLQDVGTRVYTFVWTATYCIEACAEAGIPVIVLDRPNPLGGIVAEGPPLDPEFRSFVGLASIPMRHGLTLGELLRLINAEHKIGAELHVVSLSGWNRSNLWNDLDRPWVLPSPNVPRIGGVQVYPGQVMLEGTNLSEGRGTTTPFEWCGAPFVDADRLIDVLAESKLPGVVFRAVRFIPTFDKWKGESCGGVAIHVTEAASFRPYRATVAILAACRRLWPSEFGWLDPPYEYETVKKPIEIIDGRATLHEAIDATAFDNRFDPAALDDWDRESWRRRVEPYLLYE